MTLSEEDPWLTRKMKAITGLMAAEVVITAAVVATIKVFLDAVRKSLAGDSLNLSSWPSDSLWDDLVAKNVVPQIGKVWTKRFTGVVHAFGQLVDPGSYRSAFLETVHDRLAASMWPKDTFDYVRALIDDGISNGDSVDAISQRLAKILRIDAQVDGKSVWDWQVQRISRTELMAAYNGGGFSGAEAVEAEGGGGTFKSWLATHDSRTRHTHNLANGQVVPLRQQFSVGGAALMFPGDPTGPADEVIQCRCTFLVLSSEEAEKEMGKQREAVASDPLVAAAEWVNPRKWRGVLAPLERMSGDGRIFSAPQGEIRMRTLPLALTYTPEDWGSHDGARIVGAIDRVWVEDSNIMGEGRFDMANPLAVEVVRMIEGGFHRWVSAVMDSYSAEQFCWAADAVVPCPTSPTDITSAVFPGERFTNWRLSEATLVNLPAFDEATIQLVDGEDPSLVASVTGDGELPILDDRTREWDSDAAAARLAVWADVDEDDAPIEAWEDYGRAFFYRDQDADERTKAAYKLPFADVVDGELTIIPRGVFAVAGVLQGAMGGADIPDDEQAQIKTKVSKLYERMADMFGDDAIVPPWEDNNPAEKLPAALIAAAGLISAPANPPREWFNDPQLPGPTPTTVTRDGHIFGHLTTWETCHIGFPGKCVTAMPSPSQYANFHLGAVMCDNGELLPVGNMVVSTDHADLMASARETMRHYSDSGFAAAVIRVGEDQHGPWFSGALTPEATPEQVATLLRCPPSVDYRMINGQRDLVAALCVNVPGFPIKRERVEENQQVALIACGSSASTSQAVANIQTPAVDAEVRVKKASLGMRRLVAAAKIGDADVCV